MFVTRWFVLHILFIFFCDAPKLNWDGVKYKIDIVYCVFCKFNFLWLIIFKVLSIVKFTREICQQFKKYKV